jgi:hypothetical protein
MSIEQELDEAAYAYAKLMTAAKTTEDRSQVYELLAGCIGCAIAMMGEGNPKVINAMLEGAFHYAETEAARLAGLGRILAEAKRRA